MVRVLCFVICARDCDLRFVFVIVICDRDRALHFVLCELCLGFTLVVVFCARDCTCVLWFLNYVLPVFMFCVRGCDLDLQFVLVFVLMFCALCFVAAL